MSKSGFTPERLARGKRAKFLRQSLGYNRERMGDMLGFKGNNVHNTMMRAETGNKSFSLEKLAKLEDWFKNGVPEGSPAPNLTKQRFKYYEKKRAENTPRVIELRGK